MKKSVIAVFALSLMLLASGASAANVIGLFGDVDATQCSKTFGVYVYTDVYIIAILDMIDTTGITAAEFLVDGVNAGAGDAIVAITWASPLTIGDVLGPDGFSIAFPECQPGPMIHLGTMSFFVLNGAYPAPDSRWCVVPTNDSGNLAVVDCQYVTVPADGWCFIANCTAGCDCGIATEESTWGGVKALY